VIFLINRYEIPTAFHLAPASHSEQVELRAMFDELFDQTPELALTAKAKPSVTLQGK